MTSLLIHRAVVRLIQNISKIDKTFCGSFHLTMANNLVPQQVQELQDSLAGATTTNSDLESNVLTNSVIKNLASPGNPVKAPESGKRISFRTLARLVLVLNRALRTATPAPVEADLDYWRNLAKTRGVILSRYGQVIEMQSKRIETLERDLRTLIGLARETREMLTQIAVEKRASRDHGDGEHPD